MKTTYTEQLKKLAAKIPKLTYVRDVNAIKPKPFNEKEWKKLLKAAEESRKTFTDEELLSRGIII